LAALSDATVRNRGDMAAQSFAARNYRAALAYASEVLAISPDDAAALKIRDDSRAMIARFDAAVDEARRRAAAGDVPGAAQALETARSIDPTAPGVTELSARLADQLRNQTTSSAAPAAPSGRASTGPADPAPAPVAAAQTEPRSSVQTPPPDPPPAPPPAATSVSTTPPSVAPQASQPPAPAAAAPPPAADPDTRAAGGAPTPAPTASDRAVPREPAAAPPPTAVEDDDTAVRRVVATYGRAIENKDLGLFRSVKPNLSREEERRLSEGFRAVTSQRVELTVLSIERQSQAALVQVRRRDIIQTGRQQQTAESRQTLALSRASGVWVIVEIR
jgi:hypothetical protein